MRNLKRLDELIVALFLIVMATPAARAQAPFTLEQVMSYSFPSELVSAEHRHRVAWVFNSKGVRNIWIADGSDFIHSARQVTHFTSDDGQPIASLKLTPDGKTAVYALGTKLNDAQESANPESWTKGAQQQVFAIDIDRSTSPRLLGEMGCPDEGCEDIQISPEARLGISTRRILRGMEISSSVDSWRRRSQCAFQSNG